MKGAKEYAELFSSGQYGKLRIESGQHARGKTFHIYIGEPGNEVEVYGIKDGQPGWTEWYGWKYSGRWQEDFENEVVKRKKLMEENNNFDQELAAKKQQAETDKIEKILNQY